MKNWLFIDSGENSPQFNMDFDRELISLYKKDKTPVFRLYSWNPAGVTIGANQDIEKGIDVDYCQKNGIDIVRRVTGGEAIYHDCEITYSLVCSSYDLSDSGEFRVKVKQSYIRLTQFLMLFYKELGLESERAADFYAHNFKMQISPFCFSGVQESDILINGKKIGGSAQKRERDIIFQHGSIPLKLDYEVIDNIFLNKVNKELITDILSQKGSILDTHKLKEIIKAKFQESLGCFFVNE